MRMGPRKMEEGHPRERECPSGGEMETLPRPGSVDGVLEAEVVIERRPTWRSWHPGGRSFADPGEEENATAIDDEYSCGNSAVGCADRHRGVGSHGVTDRPKPSLDVSRGRR